jgi:hypothetical protein
MDANVLRVLGIIIPSIFVGIGSIMGGILGFLLDSLFSGIIGGTFSMAILYVAIGYRNPSQQEAWVIERLGIKYRILRAGPRLLCLPGLIDKIKEIVTLRKQSQKVYQDELDHESEFGDGPTAPVRIEFWFTIADTEKDIFSWVYGTVDPNKYIEQNVDSATRAYTPKVTLEEGLQLKGNAIDILDDDLQQRLHENTGIISQECLLEDIILGDELKKLRQQEYEGKRAADKNVQEGLGHSMAVINSIMAEFKKAGYEITPETAMEFYNYQRTLDTLPKIGPNVTLISDKIKNFMAMFGAKS